MNNLMKLASAGIAVAVLAVASWWASSNQSPTLASVSFAPGEYFLKIEGISGDIRLESFEWGVAAQPPLNKHQYQPLVLHKRIDKMSPVLYRIAKEGKRFKKVTFYKNNESGGTEYSVVFEDVLVATFMHQGEGGGATLETLSLSYTRATY
jgi:type VI protein secretion system component Hcp